ncbi:MAG: hypothetical protein SFU21_03405 [Flavihumibacter sp.]|nr:hypothetical protein [Flavihumibacter sp.]
MATESTYEIRPGLNASIEEMVSAVSNEGDIDLMMAHIVKNEKAAFEEAAEEWAEDNGWTA